MRAAVLKLNHDPNGKQPPSSLEEGMSKLVGQPDAVETILPYIQMHQARLTPEGRPVGVFMLLGPTGTGKTRTVECLANALHGNEKNMVKVDCGEFQMDHEVAKLIGAPPGYLGHRETPPMLTQQKLGSVASAHSDLSLVLFDEIEKAAGSLTRLLLGVLDKAILRLGDNTTVNFDRCLIFMSTNLGAEAMQREMLQDFGFSRVQSQTSGKKLEAIGMAAARRRFSPEFINRIDAVLTYQPLNKESLKTILDQQLDAFQEHLSNRLGDRAFLIEYTDEACEWLLEKGTSPRYGARELKRVILRSIIQPLAKLISTQDEVTDITVELKDGELELYRS